MQTIVEEPYAPHGAAKELFYCRDPEILIEGPAGTGKTRAVLEFCLWACETYPGIRVLWMRKTRASLTESVLVEWEDAVLPGGQDHPCVTGKANTENRRSYTFPWDKAEILGVSYAGRSHIVLGGMDKSTRILSTQYDIICVFEAKETDEGDWEHLLTRNRNFRMPWNVSIADTNPDHDQHWLNRRAARPYTIPDELIGYLPAPRPGQTQMTRLLSRHKDNPFLFNHAETIWTQPGAMYMSKLHALTGPRRAWFLQGIWAGAEGQIWEEFDRAKHMAYRTRASSEGEDGHPRDAAGRLRVDWYFASVDWGYRAPGVMQVWGVVGGPNAPERMYLMHEIYRREQQLDWWAEAAMQYHEKYELQAIVCDPSRPENIATFNERLGPKGGRRGEWIAVEGNNAREAGWDMVRWLLDPSAGLRWHNKTRWGDPDDIELGPRLFICWEALEGVDRGLKDDFKATCTAEEVPGYVWKEILEGKPIKEEPDPASADHGCDAMRYACMFAWRHDLRPDPAPPKHEPGTMGFVLDHDDVSFDDW